MTSTDVLGSVFSWIIDSLSHLNSKFQHKLSQMSNQKQTLRPEFLGIWLSPRGKCLQSVPADFSQAWGLPWNIVDTPGVDPIKTTVFPCLSRQDLQTASCLGCDSVSHPLPFAGISTSLSPRRPYVCSLDSMRF